MSQGGLPSGYMTAPIPNLWGGVSRQAPTQRLANQVEEADNAYPSVATGATLRQGTFFERSIDDLTAGGDYRLHPIDRDGDEQYLVVLGEGDIRAFEIFGDEGTVNLGDGAAYIAGASASDLKLVTVADTTFLLNTTKVVGATIKAGDYEVDQVHDDYDAMVATVPEAGSYHQTLNDTESYNAGYFQYVPVDDIGESTPGQWLWQTEAVPAQAGNRRKWGRAAEYNLASRNPMGLAMRVRTSEIGPLTATFTEDDASNSNKPTLVITGDFFDNYTHAVGDEILIEDIYEPAESGAAPASYGAFFRIKSRIDNNTIELDPAVPPRRAQEYSYAVESYRGRLGTYDILYTALPDAPETFPTDDSLDGDYTIKGIYRRYQIKVDFAAEPALTVSDAMDRIQDAFRAAGLNSVLFSWNESGLNGIGSITVTSPFYGTQSEITGFYKPDDATVRWSLTGSQVGAKNDLYLTSNRVSSDIGTIWDAGIIYYTPTFPFHYDSGVPTSGTGTNIGFAPDELEPWQPVPPPGAASSTLDATTMPMRIERTAVAVPGSSGAVFDISSAPWKPRLNGTAQTNPVPEIFTKNVPLADIALWRGRLTLVGDEYIAMSQAGDIYNFFIEKTGDLKDSDPIERNVESDSVALIEHIVPMGDRLAIFTKSGQQFDAHTGDYPLTAENLRVPETTNLITNEAEPVSAGTSIFVAADDGPYTTVFEYFNTPETNSGSDALPLSTHAPGYLPSKIRRMAVSPDGDSFFLLPPNSNTIYLFRQYDDGRQRRQAAWARWTLGSSNRIVDIAVLETRLFLLIERPADSGSFFIEYLPITPGIPVGNDPVYDGEKYYRATDLETGSPSTIYVGVQDDPSGTDLQYASYQDRIYTFDISKCYSTTPPDSATGITSTLIDAPPSWPDPLYSGAQSIANDSTYVWETESGDTTYRVELADFADDRRWIYTESLDYTPTTHTIDSILYSEDSTASAYLKAGAYTWLHPTDPFQTIELTAIGLAFDPVNLWWQGTGTVTASTDGEYTDTTVRVERLASSWRISADIGSGVETMWTVSAGGVTDTTWRSSGPGSPAPGGGEEAIGSIDINNNVTSPVAYTKKWTRLTGSGPTGTYYLRSNTQNGMTYTEASQTEPTDITASAS